ncbi:hypothetical protein H9Q13_05435 [Pontibacter sp. JH31]|uniref:Uncharacterized protein n=1 Tax=Pontibacter aquaedesilientis TaxID=2766980 RepID=A0ABR7XFA5_9BACT|nr:hypothetical protein [Pontibacter aquaedesilientis]MBD1396601.1 hypothetical protein [Pontibacter aquaedesilientis]
MSRQKVSASRTGETASRLAKPCYKKKPVTIPESSSNNSCCNTHSAIPDTSPTITNNIGYT